MGAGPGSKVDSSTAHLPHVFIVTDAVLDGLGAPTHAHAATMARLTVFREDKQDLQDVFPQS